MTYENEIDYDIDSEVYSDDALDSMTEDDEISGSEAGFMTGYNEE
jgi:hypothetical protein